MPAVTSRGLGTGTAPALLPLPLQPWGAVRPGGHRARTSLQITPQTHTDSTLCRCAPQSTPVQPLHGLGAARGSGPSRHTDVSELTRAALRFRSLPSCDLEAGSSSAEVTFSRPWYRGTRRVFAELRSDIRCPNVTQPGAAGTRPGSHSDPCPSSQQLGTWPRHGAELPNAPTQPRPGTPRLSPAPC